MDRQAFYSRAVFFGNDWLVDIAVTKSRARLSGLERRYHDYRADAIDAQLRKAHRPSTKLQESTP